MKLSHRASKDSYYKWTHVSGNKTVKFFKHFRITREATTRVHIRTLDDTRDKALITELEKKTGLEHDPLFEDSTAPYTLTPHKEKLRLEVKTTTRIGGLLRVLSGAIRKETEKSLEAMFDNYRPRHRPVRSRRPRPSGPLAFAHKHAAADALGTWDSRPSAALPIRIPLALLWTGLSRPAKLWGVRPQERLIWAVLAFSVALWTVLRWERARHLEAQTVGCLSPVERTFSFRFRTDPEVREHYDRRYRNCDNDDIEAIIREEQTKSARRVHKPLQAPEDRQ